MSQQYIIQNLAIDWGMVDVPEEHQAVFFESVLRKSLERTIDKCVDYMPSAERKEFDQIMKGAEVDLDGVAEYLRSIFSNFERILLCEMSLVRKEFYTYKELKK